MPWSSRAALCCALASLSSTALAQGDAGPRFVAPRLLDRVEASYPEEARKQGLTGTVSIRLVVGTDGRVTSATVVKGAGHGFDESALEAARKLRFAPGTRDGTPVAVQIDYEVHFELTDVPAVALRDTARASANSEPEPLFESVVEGERPFTAASSRTVRARDFLLRPRFTPEDILRAVPGLVLAQHQGGGKADQLFLRGFDADHGTDVSINFDGVPVNMPSHAHGQGYADLHFLIPEVVERIDVTKGPYFVEYGDFDTAGAVDLVTRDRVEHSQISAMTGLFPTLNGTRDDGSPRRFLGYRVLGIGTPDSGSFRPYLAAEVSGTGGPFLYSEKLQRYNLFAKAAYPVSPATTLSLAAAAYASSWTGSGQIPARLVDQGLLDRFGSIDPTEGGDTHRLQVIASLMTRPDPRSSFTATISALRYGLTLFNDFTFDAVDPVHGDEIEQDDRRTTLYGSARYDRLDRAGPVPFLTTLGAQFRYDEVAASLWKVERRMRLPDCLAIANPCVSTEDRQSDAAVYLQEDVRPVRFLRFVVGLREDLFDFDVQSNKPGGGLDPDHPDPVPPAVQRSILSPKASAVVTPIEELDLYLNFGRGFHSNDARSAVETGGAGAVPAATGYELGARGRLFGGQLDLAAAAWRLDLDSELVWSGDAGGTVPAGATRRQGLDLEARWQILPWLYADLDVSLAHSRFKADSGNGNAVALAPSRIVTGGLTVQHPSGIRASLRVRHIGERPASQLTADDPMDPANPAGARVPPCSPALDASTAQGQRCYLVAEGYTVFDAAIGYVTRHWGVTLVAENLTNAAYREAQFGDISQVVRVPADVRPGFVPETHPIQDVHFTPGNPLALQLVGTVYF
jgi:TonB family protein